MRTPASQTAPYALLCVLSLALFAPSFNNGFRADDYNFLYNTTHSPGLMELISPGGGFAFFRPGAWALFAAEYGAFGMHSGPYIAVNWLIHLLNSALLLLVLRRSGYGAAAAAWAAGLFVLGFGHYGKQVMWACTSGPLTAVALILSAVLIALKATDPKAGSGERRLAPLGGLLVLLAASFHESSLVAPVIALALCVKAHGPWKQMRKAPVLWTTVGWLWIGVLALAASAHDTYPQAASDITMMPSRLVKYVGIMALPVQNSPLLERIWPPLGAHAHLIQLVLGFVVLAGALIYGRVRGWSVWALLAWLLVVLVPFSLVGISAGNWIELRYVYFAAMAFDTLLVLWLLERGKRFRWAVVALVVVMTATVTTTLERKYAAMATSEENQIRRGWLDPD
jgi:hypothetical protein